MKIKVLAWNMNQQRIGNWQLLHDDPAFAGTDINLLCEATGVPNQPEAMGWEAAGNGSTKGLDCECLDPERCSKRTYSTAVVSRHPVRPMPSDTRTRSGRPLPFLPSRPGTWTAARVEVADITVTAIALYGLNDEDYDASIHRSLSELSPVFDHQEYGKYLVLGGDFNILAGKPHRARPYRGLQVLERIGAYGLIDCLKEGLRADRYEDADRRADMDSCRCQQKQNCTHTRTFYDRRWPHVPYQDDYLFASPALAGGHRLERCDALPVGPESPSDHAPIIAGFQPS
jgi:hypothetical protein